MKLYHHDGVWQLPGKQDKKAMKVDVPLGAPALCEFLNDRNVPAFPVFEAESVASAVETDHLSEEEFVSFVEDKERTDFMSPPPVAKQTQFKTDEIVDFILDHASVNQCANILSSLGTRVGEQAKEGRK